MKLASEMKPEDYVIEENDGINLINIDRRDFNSLHEKTDDWISLKDRWYAARVSYQIRSIEYAIISITIVYIFGRLFF